MALSHEHFWTLPLSKATPNGAIFFSVSVCMILQYIYLRLQEIDTAPEQNLALFKFT